MALNKDQERQSPGVLASVIVEALAAKAGPRTVQRAAAGARFCGVVLDDGGAGVANICPWACGEPVGLGEGDLPESGTPALEVLRLLREGHGASLGLATANALANRPEDLGPSVVSGDVLDAVGLRPADQVGMVGYFEPLAEPLRKRVGRLTVFELGPRLSDGMLPTERAVEVLPKCQVAVITATTLTNGTLEALLESASRCREVVLLGPSTPLLAEVFARSRQRVTLLSGVVVRDVDGLLRMVARGGGTRDFMSCVQKVNVRVAAPAGD